MSAAGVRGVDSLLEAAGIDPGAGVQIVAADRLPSVAFDPSLPLVVLASDARPAPALPGRHARSGGQAVLGALYPAAHALVRLSDRSSVALETLDEAALAADDWLVPALEPIENLASPHGIAAISARLRAPDGCPWDRKQTHLTLRPYLLEEAYETVDAIENGSSAELAEELGDLLLQVILHAQFSAEAGEFDLTDVYRSIAAKIVRRHPHVFGELEVDSVEQLMTTWESIKAGERAASGKADEGAFGGVARAAGAAGQSRDPGARIGPGLGLGRHRWRVGEGRRGARGAARGDRRRGAPARAGRRPLRPRQHWTLDEA